MWHGMKRWVAVGAAVVLVVMLGCGLGLDTEQSGSGSGSKEYRYFLYATAPFQNHIRGYEIQLSDGSLVAVSGSPWTTAATTPYGLVASADGKYLFVANNGGNATERWSISSAGVLTSLGSTATSSGPRGLAQAGGNLFVVLSGSDLVGAYAIGSSGSLSFSNSGATGSYPQTVAVHSNGQYVYVTNATANTVTGLNYTGSFSAISGSPYSVGASPFQAVVHPSGNYLYVGSQTPDTISRFDISAVNGALSGETTIGVGAADPWQMVISADGKYLYTANGNGGVSVSGFAINSGSGALSALSGSPYSTSSDTRGVAIDPFGKYVYTAGYSNSQIGRFGVAADGTLSSYQTVSTGSDQPYDLLIVQVPK